MGGNTTQASLRKFNPLMVLRYSATHAQEHNKVYRLDALDAYNQKLVKKISVRGISLKGLGGTNPYVYLESIQVLTSKPPEARMEMEIRHQTGIKRVVRKVGRNANLFELSNELEQYRGFVISDINALDNTVSFTNGDFLQAGEASGAVTDPALRRIQIRETIKAHFEKEQELFSLGIKVLSLFFIDEVAKYRSYNEAGEKQPGEYAKAFEEEYDAQLNEILTLEDSPYNGYLRGIATERTHEGYFSIDKKKRLVNPRILANNSETDDVDAYDLILRRKEELLKFNEPVRFIFSHSALREGWDNPNVFVICTLRHTDNTVSRRQEVGRGLRLAVNQNGDRMDDPATVHQVNILTVVANESYIDFVTGLQQDIRAGLATRPTKADTAYFAGKVLKTDFAEETKVTDAMATAIHRYLIKNEYVDNADRITATYHEANSEGKLAAMPGELAQWEPQICRLINEVFSDAQIPIPGDDRKAKINPLNEANFHKKAFQELWGRINRKAVYTVHFESAELVGKCIAAIDAELKVTALQYTIQRGEQTDAGIVEAPEKAYAFRIKETKTDHLKISAQSVVKYDLIGKLAAETKLTRATIGAVLHGIRPPIFAEYRTNPEDFIRQAARLINEQKATVIVQHLVYSPVDDTYSTDLFTQAKPKEDFSKAKKMKHHIYDYVFTDSNVERAFVDQLDSGTDIEVYAKLPRAFFIPTPVGNYSPDWAIAFKQGTVRHIYFIAETKGSLGIQLRKIEECKIECAQKFFAKITSNQVKYGAIKSYGELWNLVNSTVSE